ncbi:MAG TPA: aspartate/glutamate racemase family protein [Bacillota bacterium]
MSKNWSIALVHGIRQVIPTMDYLTRKACPGVEVFHILQEGIFNSMLKEDGITPRILKQFSRIICEAEVSGASIILVTGSTLSPMVDTASKLVNIPVLKIDEAMAEMAVKKGKRIGLVATEELTVKPSSKILKSKAAEIGTELEIVSEVTAEARKYFKENNIEKHDQLIAECAKKLDGKVDLILFAQVSMFSALEKTQKLVNTPLYTSPELAVALVKQNLTDMGWNGN